VDATRELWREIRGQPDAVRRVLDDPDLRSGLAALAAQVRAGGELLLSGMGASLHAAEAVASLLRAQGVRAWTLPTSELLHFGAALPPGPLLLISQSGASAEIVRLLERRRDGVHGLTLDPGAPLAARGGLVMPGGPERAFAATRSFTSTIAALAMLARELGAPVDLDGMPAALQRALDEEDRVAPLVEAYQGSTALFFTGRGPLHGLANYAALLIMEMCRLPAAGLEAAQLRHGPLEVGRPELAVTAFAADGATRDLILRLARDVAATGARSVLLDASRGDAADGGESDAKVLRWPLEALPEADAVAPLAVVVQLAAYRLARARGIAPGVPLRSSKVTREE
jgi:glucosamine--fructose-6-phosphate aminotransferase (isomerizing)